MSHTVNMWTALVSLLCICSDGESLHSITLNSVDPATIALRVMYEIQQHGYVFINNSHLGDTISVDRTSTTGDISGLDALSQFTSAMFALSSAEHNTSEHFSYSLGVASGRTELSPGIFLVGGAPKHVLVTAHTEASYLSKAPAYLIFACPGTPDLSKGGQTTVYPIADVVEGVSRSAVGRRLLREVAEFGVIYIRNDVDEQDTASARIWNATNYPTWQSRFAQFAENIESVHTNSISQIDRWREQISIHVRANGQEATWIPKGDGMWTLRTTWRLAGFSLYPTGSTTGDGEAVWFNQIHGLNGRWFDQHGVDGMDTVSLTDRPLHSLVGDGGDGLGRELSDVEYALLSSVHREVRLKIPWRHSGDVAVIDNFAYLHGRMPYHDTFRKCVIHYGPAVQVRAADYNNDDDVAVCAADVQTDSLG